jgi:HAD superfamily phosphoserine phosphatase-like hydrolase
VSKPYAAFDIDGTLIRWQLYHAIADALVRLGFGDAKAFGKVREARMSWKRRAHPESFKTYEGTLVEVVDKMLLSLTFDQYTEAIEAVFNEYKDQAYTFTRDLIGQLKKQGYLLFAISGSQEEIVAKIAKHYGFDDFVGSSYIRQGAGFSGQKVVRTHDKHKTLAELVKKHAAGQQGSVGVGDSAGDISMLEAVEQPVAFNPEQKLYAHARAKGWKIVVERKNVVYELRHDDGDYTLEVNP